MPQYLDQKEIPMKQRLLATCHATKATIKTNSCEYRFSNKQAVYVLYIWTILVVLCISAIIFYIISYNFLLLTITELFVILYLLVTLNRTNIKQTLDKHLENK